MRKLRFVVQGVLRVVMLVVLLASLTLPLAGCGGGGSGSGGGSTVTTTTGGGGGNGGGSDPSPSPTPSTSPTTNPWNSKEKANQLLVKPASSLRSVSRAVADSNQYEPVATSDGSDGAWTAWFDNRAANLAYDVFVGNFTGDFVQRAGFEVGVPAFVASSGVRQLPAAATFGDGSLLVACEDSRYGPRMAISANRLVQGAAGPSYPWGAAGTRVSVVDYENTIPHDPLDPPLPLIDNSNFREQRFPLAIVQTDNVGLVVNQETSGSAGLSFCRIGQDHDPATPVTVLSLRSGGCRLSALVAGANGGAYVAWDEGSSAFEAFIPPTGDPVVWSLGDGEFPRLAALPNGDVAAGFSSDREAGITKPFGGAYGPDGTIRWEGKVSDTPCHFDQGVDVTGHPGNVASFSWEGASSEAVYSRRVSLSGNPAAELTLTTLSGARALPQVLGEGNNLHLLASTASSLLYNTFDPSGVGSHGSAALNFTAGSVGARKIRGFPVPGSPRGEFVTVFEEILDGHNKVAGRRPSRQ